MTRQDRCTDRASKAVNELVQSLVWNTSFSMALPTLQLAWDSVSLGALKFCPRYYQLTIVEGWEPRARSVDLSFGIWLHESRERYYHARARGGDHAEGLRAALHHALMVTWDSALGRGWISDDPNKNRLTLARSIVWYLDHYEHDALETIILANGKPAVELSFSFQTDYVARTGEPYVLCGHLDRPVRLNGVVYNSDLKSTKHTIGPHYFNQFAPDNQLSLYAFAMKVVYKLPSQGTIVDALQVAVDFTRPARAMLSHTQAQLDEWYADLGWWLGNAEAYASAAYWPMNDRNCWRCAFRPICARPPSARQQWLAADYVRRVWDPLQRRGDI
jgi:hypothetical protein